MNRTLRVRQFAKLLVLLGLSAGCSREENQPKTTFYQRSIAPILETSCSRSPSGSSCHVAADKKGNALGNLNVDSYTSLTLRRDLLKDYGPYGIPALLLKAVPPFALELSNWEEQTVKITTDVPHAGGSLLEFTGTSFTQLERWLNNGAAENNSPVPPADPELSPCSSALGVDPLFDPSLDPSTPDYRRFADSVNDVVSSRCAAGNCHGASANSLYLTCGESVEQVRWNYFAARAYVARNPSSSELVRRPLDPSAGGAFHEGGVVFSSTADKDYAALLAWAKEAGSPGDVPTDPGFVYFAERVQPMLVKRGCMILGCHSPAIFHDYRLRGGSGGHFGLPATRTNYRLTLEQVALESPDPNTSRLLRKNLIPAPDGPGIAHRGGALFAGRSVAECDFAAADSGVLDEQEPYCVLASWIAKERAVRMAEAKPFSGIAFVRRPPAPLPDTPQDYGVYAAGAEVILQAGTLDAMGGVVLGAETSLSQLCGLDVATSDARRPAVSWDGNRIAFAARQSATEPFQIYVVEAGSCAVEARIAAPAVGPAGETLPNNDELVHNFDPAFAPDGRLVFASTRGNVQNLEAFDYAGPQRSPADPARLNANLYILEDTGIRQLTFLLNQELSPAFMGDGRLILVTEKRTPNFYQLAGRRLNLDGADYHPLFGQRSTIDFNQLTDVVELADKNFAVVLSEKGAAHSAGTLAIINRSIGVDQASLDPADYTQDPAAIDWPNPKFYQHALRFIDPAATGKLTGTDGAYRNPAPFPDGRVLVSYAANVVNLEDFSGVFEIVLVDPLTGARTPLITAANDLLWPVAVYARPDRGVFASRLDEANGASKISGPSDRAQVTFMDVALSASLFFQNTRTGRHVAEGQPALEVWESLPPEAGVTSLDQGGAFVTDDAFGSLYHRRRLLGSAFVQTDGSSKIEVPGGLPLYLATNAQLADEKAGALHLQREEVQFYPGEVVRQGFRREFFNALCAGCHGTLSGFESDFAVNPDILTQASNVVARDAKASDLVGIDRGPITGPKFP